VKTLTFFILGFPLQDLKAKEHDFEERLQQQKQLNEEKLNVCIKSKEKDGKTMTLKQFTTVLPYKIECIS
jgi:hypothetical protein